ncbi:MAG: hypothetical protein KAV44_08520 [Bacteroidales bacterium]|nr:hypothetical protein [Bacteroidales bacterium]
MPTKEEYHKIFDSFSNQKILIIGDVMVDSYLWGTVERISPEAPVPVVSVNKRANRLGGAANVALNIKALGAEPILCSVIGNDQKGDDFINLLKNDNLSIQGIHKSSKRITTTKFRVIGNNTQMLRVDEEITSDLDKDDEKQLVSIITKLLKEENINAVIFQDYNKGIFTPGLIKKVISKANDLNIPVVVDPKKKNFTAYKNITLFKPNLKELKEGLNIDININDINELANANHLLHKNQNIKIIMTTLSEVGVFVSAFTDDNKFITHSIPAHVRSVSDVSGAGDTVISVASLCLSLNLPPEIIASISNLAGGIVCEEVGVVPINKEKLMNEVLKLFN